MTEFRASKLSSSVLSAFVVEQTHIQRLALIPELPLRLADEMVPVWEAMNVLVGSEKTEPPFWAFAWAGGQALARFVLDHPELVAGKRVLDFACGCGAAAIAAAKCGATQVLAVDIDPLAVIAVGLNAELNGVAVQTSTEDLLDAADVDADVILCGDICYERTMSARVKSWAGRLARSNRLIILGDPGRNYFEDRDLELRATWEVQTTRDLESRESRVTSVYVWRNGPRPTELALK